MTDFHRHAAWGRVRRPKNILGPDGTVVTSASTSDTTIIDNAAPDNDLTGTITAASINTTTATITLTFGNGSVPDTAQVGESVITRGFHPSIDGRLLPLTAVSSGDNTLSFKVPSDNFSQNLVNSLNLQVKGTCTRQTLDGRKTENARYLHLFLQDSTAGGVTITVYGYNFAFGRWAVLQLPVGFSTQQTGDDGDADGGDVVQAASTAESSYVDAQFTAVAAAKTHIIPIAGIDKVYFVSSAANDADVIIGAAISTF